MHVSFGLAVLFSDVMWCCTYGVVECRTGHLWWIRLTAVSRGEILLRLSDTHPPLYAVYLIFYCTRSKHKYYLTFQTAMDNCLSPLIIAVFAALYACRFDLSGVLLTVAFYSSWRKSRFFSKRSKRSSPRI